MKIIKSNIEPSPKDLWLYKGELRKYENGWNSISSTQSENSQQDVIVLVNGMQFTNSSMTKCPPLDTSAMTSYAGLFRECSQLEELPELDFKNVKDISYMCSGCTSLSSFPDIDFRKIENLKSTFSNCTFVTDEWFKKIDFSNIKNLDSAFFNCNNLTNVKLDCANLISLNQTFCKCSNLQEIELYNTSNITDYYGAFMDTSISKLPNIDTRNAVSIGAFIFGTNIVELPPLDTSKCKNFNYMLDNCTKIAKICQLDFSSAMYMSSFCHYSNKALRYIKIINLGKSDLTTYKGFAVNWGTGGEENRQSVIDTLIVYSYDRAANGKEAATITLPANTKALLTEEEIAQITQKGYTLS